MRINEPWKHRLAFKVKNVRILPRSCKNLSFRADSQDSIAANGKRFGLREFAVYSEDSPTFKDSCRFFACLRAPWQSG